MKDDDGLAVARQYADIALTNNDVFYVYKLWKLVCQALGWHSSGSDEDYIETMKVTQDILDARFPYAVKMQRDEPPALNDIKDMVSLNNLGGSVGVDYNGNLPSDLYCSDKHTAVVLALHF